MISSRKDCSRERHRPSAVLQYDGQCPHFSPFHPVVMDSSRVVYQCLLDTILCGTTDNSAAFACFRQDRPHSGFMDVQLLSHETPSHYGGGAGQPAKAGHLAVVSV